MDWEAVQFSGQALFQLSGNALAKLSYIYRTTDLSPTSQCLRAIPSFSTSVITFQKQNHKRLKTKVIMLKLIKCMKYSTLLCEEAVN